MLSHGFVIVEYRRTISEDDRDALADWTEDEGLGVVAVPATAGTPYALDARTPGRRLTCRRVSVDALSAFRDST